MNALIEQVTTWAKTQPDIIALGLVGSWARGNPHRRSDIDFMVLSHSPFSRLHEVRWNKDLCRNHLGAPLKAFCSAHYGVVWSRHFWLASGQEIELSFASPAWAEVEPVDAGTRYVVIDALTVLYDPAQLLATLKACVSRGDGGLAGTAGGAARSTLRNPPDAPGQSGVMLAHSS
jgi:uncharacterized protein